MDTLNLPVTAIAGVGDKAKECFKKKNIEKIKDLITYYPKDYFVFKEYKSSFFDAMNNNAPVLAKSLKNPTQSFTGKYTITKCTFVDMDNNYISCSWFNVYSVPVNKGQLVVLQGDMKINGEYNNITQPTVYIKEEYDKLLNKLKPLYPLTKGTNNNFFEKHIRTAIKMLDEDIHLDIPDELIKKYKMPSAKEIYSQIHNPEDIKKKEAAQNCLAYEELFNFFLKLEKERTSKKTNKFSFANNKILEKFINNIPFDLTTDQKKVLKDIINDLNSDFISERLIQGDVGSGKTLVALSSLVYAVSNNYQGVLLAPTSVLATQHYKEAIERTEGLGIKVRLLTNDIKAKEKREIEEELANEEPLILVSTHSAIHIADKFSKLALVIIDEQHKFGVDQRETLMKNNPHIISMTATPIPRSLARTLFGTNEVSEIKTMPAGRKPVKTKALYGKDKLKDAVKMLEFAKANGNQSYVVCPAISENEETEKDLLNVDYMVDYLKKHSTLKVAGVHSKTTNKDKLMKDFEKGDYDVLVSTTVIEVGVNVPNTTVMLIVNAERFGLATLHQLRGRVGRNSLQSYCVLLDCLDSIKSQQRMKIMESTNDGFKISEEDLAIRGPGELFGKEQSGMLTFKIADIYNTKLVNLAKNDAINYKNTQKICY